MSVDIVGSTALKQNNLQDNSKIWIAAINKFNTQMSAYFMGCINSNKTKPIYEDISKLIIIPDIWKSVGDEIIYKVRIKSYKVALFYILNFKESIETYVSKHYSNSETYGHLDLKATSWTAGFPVKNSILTSIQANKDFTDYIGPSMDVGFRICKFSTNRRFVIGHSLAIFLLEYKSDHLKIIYQGKQKIHGIDKDYPIIYIQMNNKRIKDDEFVLTNACEPDGTKLLDYLKSDKKNEVPFLSECEFFDTISEQYKELFTFQLKYIDKDTNINSYDDTNVSDIDPCEFIEEYLISK